MPFYNHAGIFTIFRKKNYNFTLSFAFSHMNILTPRYLHLPSLFLYFFYQRDISTYYLFFCTFHYQAFTPACQKTQIVSIKATHDFHDLMALLK